MSGTDAQAVRRVLVGVLVLNVAVAAAKVLYGLSSGSLAIVSDAVHSLSDGASNVIGLVVMHFATAPPDDGHPYGHRKLEIVAAAGIGVAIGVVALRFGYSAVSALVHDQPPPVTSVTGYVVLVGTLVVNIVVTLYERKRAWELGSPYLAADAAHTASDIAVTSAVLVSFAATRLGVAWADAAGALLVVAVIARVAWRVFSDNVSILIDRAAVSTAEVEAVVLSVPGVRGCHRVRSRGVGDAVHLDLHVVCDPDLTVHSAHALMHDVESALRSRLPGIIDVVIHIEPEGDVAEDL